MFTVLSFNEMFYHDFSTDIHSVTQHLIMRGSLQIKAFRAFDNASPVSASEFVTKFLGSNDDKKTCRKLVKISLEALGVVPDIWPPLLLCEKPMLT